MPDKDGGPEVVWDAWRDGDQLVLVADPLLPDRCDKTDLPAEGHTADVVAILYEPAVYWLLVLNPILYLIVARAVGTRVVVSVGVIPAAIRASRREWVLTWLLLGGGVPVWLAAALLQAPEFFWLGLLLMVAAIPVYSSAPASSA